MAGLLSPLAPGLSGAINPLAFIGAGMASGNPAQALQQMGDLQLAAQQLQQNQLYNQQRMALMQAESERERRKFEQEQEQIATFKALAPNVAAEMGLPPVFGQTPSLLPTLLGAQIKAATPSGSLKTFREVMALPQAEREQYFDYQRQISPFGGLSDMTAPLGTKAKDWTNDLGQSPPPSSTGAEAMQAGFRPGSRPTLTAGEFKEQTQTQQAAELVASIDQALDEGAGTGPASAARAYAAATPWLSWAVTLSPEEAKLASNLAALEKMLIAAMRGAQVGPQEEASFRRTLPSLGQDDPLFEANLTTTKNNIATLLRRGAERQRVPGAGQPTFEGWEE